MGIAAAPPLGAAVALAWGACSPLGFGSRQLEAAMAASVRNFEEGETRGYRGGLARLSRLSHIGAEASRVDRLAFLLRNAIADLEAATGTIPDITHLVLALPPDLTSADLARLGGIVADALPACRGGPRHIETIAQGRIAFLMAIGRGCALLTSGQCRLALVIGVDSLCAPETVDALMRQRRVLTETGDGTIPGEAAVATLLGLPASRTPAGLAPTLVTEPCVEADDPGLLFRFPQRAGGLGRAFTRLRGHPLVTHPVRAVVTFDSGELPFTRAFANAYLRNAPLMPEPMRFEAIATSVGDTGAAAGGVALLRARQMMRRESGGALSSMLVYGHADSGRCAASLLFCRTDEEPS